ncbi:hypothetical protein V8C37DRAFT_111237 [Trichoderma ceciliae]
MSSESQTAKNGPWTEETKQKFESKSKSEFYDPCQEAAQRSYKCLYRNNGDKSMCGEYFQYVLTSQLWQWQLAPVVPGDEADVWFRAYRDCKQAWTERRRKEKGTLW